MARAAVPVPALVWAALFGPALVADHRASAGAAAAGLGFSWPASFRF
ncbi:hypothetical protein [Streptomyces goshikiensis]